MKVFEFGTVSYGSKEWIVAENFISAAQCAGTVCDLVDLDDHETLTVRMLKDEELLTMKFDPDPQGTGEFDPERGIPFKEEIAQRTEAMPYLLCSLID